jgi:hypothetical protein
MFFGQMVEISQGPDCVYCFWIGFPLGSPASAHWSVLDFEPKIKTKPIAPRKENCSNKIYVVYRTNIQISTGS